MSDVSTAIDTETWRTRLQVFCGGTGDPETLQVPFIRNGLLGATDGRICAVVLCGVAFADDSPPTWGDGRLRHRPDLRAVVQPLMGQCFEWLPLPSLPPCKRCKETGVVPLTACDECSGLGTVTCEYDHEHDCPDCDGTGESQGGECDECPSVEVAPGLHMHARYLRLMTRADAEFGPVQIGHNAANTDRVVFTSGAHREVFGVVMLLERPQWRQTPWEGER